VKALFGGWFTRVKNIFGKGEEEQNVEKAEPVEEKKEEEEK